MLPRAPPLLPRSSSYRAMNSNHSIQTSQLKPINQTTQLKPINSIRTIQNQPLNSTLNSTPMILSNPIALWLLSASLVHLPRAFLSTSIALCASLMGGDLSAMSRDARLCPRCLRARYAHPYRTLAPLCLTLAPAKKHF